MERFWFGWEYRAGQVKARIKTDKKLIKNDE